MAALLAGWGCTVVAAGGIAEAVAASSDERIDLIVSDYRLRNRETGVELVRAMRERHGDLPAILITGDTDPDRQREAVSLGFVYLHKPVLEATLRRSIAQAMQHAGKQ